LKDERPRKSNLVEAFERGNVTTEKEGRKTFKKAVKGGIRGDIKDGFYPFGKKNRDH